MPPSQEPAQQPAPSAERKPPRWHLYFGFDGAARSLFGHDGLIWAPTGDLHSTGWRIRAGSNGGVFSYLTSGRRITGELFGAELLAGHQWLWPNGGVTAFAGPVVQDSSTDPYDPGKPRQGTRFGGKIVLEGWMRPVDGVVLNLSGHYASAAETYFGRFATTLEITPAIAIEPEFMAFGEPGYDAQRLGAMIEYRFGERVRFRVGGGLSRDPDGEGTYGALQVKIWR